ncbi:PKD domain-containing protein [Frankia sp. AgKG'84/4]|uniref:PKD domain-containing protein n=1 Tax=Frankia sp. AgKG'84/4 TaxID=573490 RepID=UPI00200F75C1|nr:PKD domain-containing protein [Frankia sp. AgKG'84/4]MCL9793094.1 PKD domain-containing protein [Frankia sp. AgKG'84/4]
MSPDERAGYDRTVSGCGNYLLVDGPVPLAQVQTALTEIMRETLLPESSITATTWTPGLARPGFHFHANGPSTYSGDTTRTAEPLAATIHASPRYHWDFGDGTAEATSNMALAAKGGSAVDVTHRYSRPGYFRVAVTVTWTGTFALAGVPQLLPLQPVRLSTATEIRVTPLDTVGALPR